MSVSRIAVGRNSRHECLQIPHHVRVSVFTEHEGGAGVANKDMAHAGLYSGLGNIALHVRTQVIGTAATGLYPQFSSGDHSTGMYGIP